MRVRASALPLGAYRFLPSPPSLCLCLCFPNSTSVCFHHCLSLCLFLTVSLCARHPPALFCVCVSLGGCVYLPVSISLRITEKQNSAVDGWVEEWTDGRMDGWTEGRAGGSLRPTDSRRGNEQAHPIPAQASRAAKSHWAIDLSHPLMPSLPKAWASHFRLNPKLLPQGLVASIQFYC